MRMADTSHKSLVIDERDGECYITKFELWREAVKHIGRAFSCWPLSRRYGFRDWRNAVEFLDNAQLCIRSSWRARWR